MILGLCPTNERRRYFVTTSLIDWMQTLPPDHAAWGLVIANMQKILSMTPSWRYTIMISDFNTTYVWTLSRTPGYTGQTHGVSDNVIRTRHGTTFLWRHKGLMTSQSIDLIKRPIYPCDLIEIYERIYTCVTKNSWHQNVINRHLCNSVWYISMPMCILGHRYLKTLKGRTYILRSWEFESPTKYIDCVIIYMVYLYPIEFTYHTLGYRFNVIL